MSTIHLRGAIAAAMLYACTASASADLIIFSTNRSVTTGYTFLPDGGLFPNDVSSSDSIAGAGLWDTSVELQEEGVFDGFATQITSVSTTSFMGSFSGSFDAQEGIDGLGTPLGAQAAVQLLVFFELTETTTFAVNISSSVTGLTTAAGFQGMSVGDFLFPLDETGVVSEFVTLDAGGYIFNFTYDHATDGLGDGAFSHVFSFTVIPGPGALTVLAIGLFVAPRRRRLQ